MKLNLPLDLESARARLRPALAALRTHRFWVECGGLSVLAVAAGLLVGQSSLRRAEHLDARARELVQIRTGLLQWTRALRPPTPQESQNWHESQRLVESLNHEASDPLVVAKVLAQRAEEVGVEDLRIRLAHPDSLVPGVRLPFGGWTLESADAGLVVEFAGDMGDVIGLLGALPPQVEVASLSASATDGPLRARVVLQTRRAVAGGE